MITPTAALSAPPTPRDNRQIERIGVTELNTACGRPPARISAAMRYSGRRVLSRENRAIWAGSGLSIRIADRLAHVVLSVDVSKEPPVSFLQSTEEPSGAFRGRWKSFELGGE
jgi:hypothetical protein